MRLIGLAQQDPRVPVTGSGAVARFLFDALERRHELVDRRGVDLTRTQRYLLAAASFHPDRARWSARLNWGTRAMALRMRSRNSARALRDVREPFDFAVQTFGLFRTQGAPYVIYTDNTVNLSRTRWPDWVPVEGRDLDRLYEFERRLFRGALHSFTMGQAAAESLVSFYGVPEESVSVAGGGAAFETLPERGGGPGSEPVILFVGNEWARKGGDILLEAFRRVRASRPDARLRLVGTDAPAPEPGVDVLGRVSGRDRIAELYAQSAVFCMPSRFEPYGLAVTEAMAYELPCVVTSVGGLSEIVLDGETGLIVPPEDPVALAGALLRLLDDREHAAWLGRNGRARVERHQNWDAVVERMQPSLELARERLLGAAPPAAVEAGDLRTRSGGRVSR
jgi:glycosyltransferase involved in cell wall biosynthesis